MAAARHIPITEAVRTITINSSFIPSPQGLKVQQGDTVNFQNNSGVDISIQFAPNPPGLALSPTNPLPVPHGSSAGFTAPDYDAAANYYIYVGTVNQNPTDPYAIQVGNGPLYVQVTWSPSLGAGQTNPDPVAIPAQGNLQMFSTDTTSYTATWPNTGDPFTLPQNLTQVVPVVANNLNYTATSGVATYKFTLLKKSPSRTLGSGNGGGTVKVKNT